MADINKIGRALQGFGAGVAGRGGEFIQGLRQEEQRLDAARSNALLQDAFAAREHLKNDNVSGALSLLDNRLAGLNELGGDPSDTQAMRDMIAGGDISGAINELSIPINFAVGQGLFKPPQIAGPEATAEQRTFDALTEDLSEEDKTKAKMIKLGLTPRAADSAVERIAGDEALTNAVANSQQTIKQREKFGAMTGASRAKAIDSGFAKMAKIDGAVRNIDRAISVLDSGAGVGAIERFLPSFKAASVELDNIQGVMALDVVGATTFGALSAGELQLAKEVALPKGLGTDELIDHLNRRKVAQNKLRDYFNEQIQFLDQGGTVAGFLRQKEREVSAGEAQGQAPAQDLSGLSDEEIDRMLGQGQ